MSGAGSARRHALAVHWLLVCRWAMQGLHELCRVTLHPVPALTLVCACVLCACVQVGDSISCVVYDVEAGGIPLLTQRLPEEADDELAELADEMDQVGLWFRGMGFQAWGLGLGVQGMGLRAWGSAHGVLGPGVQGVTAAQHLPEGLCGCSEG
jgi:hypothetical protein